MKEPDLDNHWRDEDGKIRKKRNDTHAGTLSEDYPKFDRFRVDRKLRNIKKDLGLPQDASSKEIRKDSNSHLVSVTRRDRCVAASTQNNTSREGVIQRRATPISLTPQSCTTFAVCDCSSGNGKCVFVLIF